MPLFTDRLMLREFEKSDFDAVLAYASRLENVKYMPFGSNGEQDTRAFIDVCIARQAGR